MVVVLQVWCIAEMQGKQEAMRNWGHDDGGVTDDGLGVWFWCYHYFVCIFGLWIAGSKGLGLVCCCYCSMFVWCRLFAFGFEEYGIS